MPSQFFVFAVSLGCGALIGVLFDFFRAFRKKVNSGVLWVSVQDLLFWVLASFFTFLVTYFVNGGELRWYIFFALFCGALIYNATLSHAVIWLILQLTNILSFIANTLLKFIIFPLVLIYKPLKKPFLLLSIPVKRFLKSFKISFKEWMNGIKKVKKRLKLY